ncbi:D-alanyl-D-alanine carboxypeptidase family protein [Xanthobacter sp. V0B-10]|uniref:D-alanyl-D-alanine carboxypeptidase family protein n=1 Tax=Xanthobacter albus TaxID=3119929 RepID=UPI003729EA54
MTETIKDYLVTLGFKVEKGEEARFKDILSGVAKTAAGIAAALSAAGVAITATVLKVASDFDSLYFAAMRSNATVASIKSLSYALSQVGGSSGQAAAAIDGVATAIRTSPGIEGLLNSLGVATRENGRLKDTAAIIDGIVETLGKKPYYVSAQIAGVLGIDEKSFQVLVTQWPKIKAFQDEYNRQAASLGVDPDKAAESSNRLMTSFRQLSTTVSLVMDKIVTDLQPVLSQYLKEFGEWVASHSEEIRSAILMIVEAVVGLVKDLAALAKALSPVVDKFIAMSEALVGPNGLKAALDAVMIFMVGTWLVRMTAVLATLMRHPAFIALAAIAGISYDIFGMTDQQKLDVGSGVNDAINGKAADPDNWWTRGQNWVREKFGMGPVDNKGAPKQGADGKQGADSSADRQKDGINPELQQRFQKMLDGAPDYVKNGVRVTSGYRSEDRQRQLWEEALKKYGSAEEARKWVAPPGRSQHNKGEAYDLQFDSPEARAWVHEHANEYGLKFPLPNENWHMERSDGREGRGNEADQKREQRSDAGPVPEQRTQDERLAVAAPVLKIPEGFGADLMQKQALLMGGSLQSALVSPVSRSVSISQETKVNITGSKDPQGTSDAVTSAQQRINADLFSNGRSAFA